MKRAMFFLSIAILIVALIIVSTAAAQSGGSYDLSWSTIAGGGGTSSSSGYSLSGTIGQADAGGLSGGSYTLNGGFWNEAGQSGAQLIYLPLVLR
jgi:hypothetical protein